MQRAVGVALFGAALALVASVGYWELRVRPRVPAVATAVASQAPAAVVVAPPGTLVDPLDPDRPMNVDATARVDAGKSARAGHVALSAWSAGFVGIEAALAQPASKDVDAVILIDGLHAPRGDDNAFEAQLKPFVDYAARAARGERFMLVSHSSIDPPSFASTTECAHYLIASLTGRPQPVRRADALGLELVEAFSRGDFHVRGYAGNDKADHCAQLGVLREAFAALGRHWAASTAPRTGTGIGAAAPSVGSAR